MRKKIAKRFSHGRTLLLPFIEFFFVSSVFVSRRSEEDQTRMAKCFFAGGGGPEVPGLQFSLQRARLIFMWFGLGCVRQGAGLRRSHGRPVDSTIHGLQWLWLTFCGFSKGGCVKVMFGLLGCRFGTRAVCVRRVLERVAWLFVEKLGFGN